MELPFYEKEKLDPAFPFLAWERIHPAFWFPLHWHAQVELVHILSGRLEVIHNGQSREGREGDIVIADTGTVHGFSNPAPETGARIFQFGLEIFSGALPEIRGEEQASVFSRKPILNEREDGTLHARVGRLLTEMYHEYRERAPGFRLQVISRLYEITVDLLRKIPPGQAPGIKLKANHDRLDRIFAFIVENFEDPQLSLEMAADSACLNKFYFSRFMKEQTGMSFYEYLSRMRLYRAEQYLAESDMPVADIAHSCGFNSIATFNRLFKAYTGATPSSYRTGRAAGKNRNS
ncbi:MAG: AraC family transcriptional regulator [Treponema sp.]|jgi:AraC-like DNA-binding protein|nr:AraC family transcriptional regulator [Treponema sp.]